MKGGAAPLDPARRGHVREASWLDLPRDLVDIAPTGPPIWRWSVPLRTDRIRVDAYLGPYREGASSQDALLVLEDTSHLVLAVADGVAPSGRTPIVEGLDGARFAARTVLERVCTAAPSADLGHVLRAANAALIDRFGPAARPDLEPRDRPQTAAAALGLRLTDGGSVTPTNSARAADCEIWARRGGRWMPESRQPMLKHRARATLDEWDRAHPTAHYLDRIVLENTLLDDTSEWNVTALGRFETPKIDIPELRDGFDQLVLMTDGLEPSSHDFDPSKGPTEWVSRLRQRARSARWREHSHTDVAMLHLQLLKHESDS